MSTVSKSPQRSVGFLPVVVAALGVVLLGYGALAFASSPLGGAWLGLAGLCLLLSGVVATPWAADRFDLTPAQQRTTALVFGVGGAALLALFVLVNVASFEGGSSSS
ncbi:hypothetical protein B4589_011600 [Halolamina sp. CBA1230]|uniref:hypothetical protein n=1 Tax=Halolamina sp. CBA1230 TaxID=1853690 RepID=UPI001179E7A9|nr:hypothetical protein [Halolamina sp. CBA1230]QKY20986.1 hypothetical protein B4589_011600 [Halolamina sp. CBA1230]